MTTTKKIINSEKSSKIATYLRPPSWIRYIASGLLLILLGFFVFYFLYVEKQKELQSQYLLRLLTTAGQNVGETISGLRGNIESALKAETKGAIEDKLELVPFLDSGSYKWEEREKGEEITPDKVSIDMSIDDDKGEFVLTFSVKESNTQSNEGKKIFQIHAKLTKLLLPSLPYDVFEKDNGSVLVARRTGRIILQKGDETVQLTELPREESSGDGESEVSQDFLKNTQVCDVKIGGTKYKLLLQPYRLPLDIEWNVSYSESSNNSKTEDFWLMGGMIPSSTFRAKTMIVSPTFVLVVLCFLIIGLLCLPFLRIRFIGLREGLRAHDVLVLAVALMVGCSLAAFAIIHLLTYITESNIQESQLKLTAENIRDHVKSELDSLECQLIHLTRMSKQPPGNTFKGNILNEYDIKYPHFEMAFGMAKDGLQEWKWSNKKTTTAQLLLPEREYFKHAKDYDLWLQPSEKDSLSIDRTGFLDGRFIQSIRSKTTSEVFAIMSVRHVEPDMNRVIVSAIEAELLSLINPVMPSGYGFAVINQEGIVQFHSDKRHNLREDFFKEIYPEQEVKAAVISGLSRHIDITYRAEPQSAFVMPLAAGTPWTLIVFRDEAILRHLDLEILTFALAIFGLYILVFLLSSILIHFCGSRKTAHGEAHRMWFWPDRTRLESYCRLLSWTALFTALWCLGSILFQSLMVLWCLIYPSIMIVLLHWYLRRRHVPKTTLAGKIVSSSKWHWVYTALIVGLFFNVAILPPITFYNTAHKEEVTVFAKLHQLELAKSLRNRVDHHVGRFRHVEIKSQNSDRLRDSLRLSNLENTAIESATDVYAQKSRIREYINGRRPPWENQSRQKLIAFLSRIPILKPYDEMSSKTRALSDPRAIRDQEDEYNITWSTVEKPGWLSMNILDFRTSVFLGAATEPIDNLRQIHLQMETPLYYLKSVNTIWFITALIAVILALLWIIKTIMRIVFIIDMRYPLSFKCEDFITDPDIDRQMRIRIHEEKTQPTTGQLQYLISFQDILTAKSVQDLLVGIKDTPKTEIHLPEFDYGLNDPKIAQKKLELLEGLIKMEKTQIVINSTIEPLLLLMSPTLDFLKEKGTGQLPFERWAAELQRFVQLQLRASEGEFSELRNQFKEKLEESDKFKKLPQDVQNSLVSEGWQNRLLKSYAMLLSSCQELGHYTADDVIDQIQDLAAAHYWQIWEACNTDEKVLLYRLAQDGFVNWQMKDTLSSLIRRRLIVTDPNFRLMNESFRRFILRAERPEVFREWEQAIGVSMWSRVRTPLILSGIVLAAFFFATQRDIFNQSLGLLTSLMIGAPALIKIFGILTQSRHTSSTQS